MKLKERISWLMGTVQQSLFPHLDECLPEPFTVRDKHLVKILELIQIEKFVPNSANRQWLGRPIKEREAIARAFVAKAVFKYQGGFKSEVQQPVVVWCNTSPPRITPHAVT